MRNRQQKPKKKNLFIHIANVVSIALIVECFLCAILAVRHLAKEACFERVEETTQQMASMFNHGMDDALARLTVFADILGANSSNPDELLMTYMENFCRTQDFSAVCIHRANGSTVSYGKHPHEEDHIHDLEREVAASPYVSKVYRMGETPEEQCFYQVVPIYRGGEAVGMLYGYMPLSELPNTIDATAYGGACQVYIVDGDTGDLLVDSWQGSGLGSINDEAMDNLETRDSLDAQQIREGIRSGRSGYYSFRSRSSGEWYYCYYMPLGVNRWVIQLVIDEPTAFASYNEVSRVMFILFACVVAMLLLHVYALMLQNLHTHKKERVRLQKADYMYNVQHALFNAHNNAEFIELALKTVADKLKAETVLLLSLSSRTVSNVHYWPSKDRQAASNLHGRNIQEDFPSLYDQMRANNSMLYDEKDQGAFGLSDQEAALLKQLDIRQLMLCPITDHAGTLKGVICAVNLPDKQKDLSWLECVTYDFFMAITNVENHNIIKRMGAMDYLTNMKNRNSYEAEAEQLALLEGGNLWCVFIDVNGLHEVNNSKGHKAGDLMLCAVAEAVKKTFGSQYAYRLGGDEFVVFVQDSDEAVFARKKADITALLAKKGYYVSVGFAGVDRAGHSAFDIEHLMAEAETAMYHEKWIYYQENNIPAERGHFPRLER